MIDKRSIFDAIEASGYFDTLAEQGTVADVLVKVFDLHNRPAQDERCRSFYEDIIQHYVRNNDYSWEKLFISDLGLLKISDDQFIDFLEALLSPAADLDQDNYQDFIRRINPTLAKSNLKYIYAYNDEKGNPIFRVKEISGISAPHVAPNKVKIFVDKDADYPTNRYGNHKKPTSVPAIVLAYDFRWSDYNISTQFDVFFYKTLNNPIYCGKVKIIAFDTPYYTDETHETYDVIKFLDDSYDALPDNFCSLGQNANYYSLIQGKLTKEEFLSFMWAMRDCAFYPSLQELFTKAPHWSSLTRDDAAERAMRTERNKFLHGGRVSYDFNYTFTPPYSNGRTTDIYFPFSTNGALPRRLLALIGKNGAGKTKLLTTLPLDLALKKEELFDNALPSFGKIIAISNSYYDNFEIPQPDAEFNYVYCGLSRQEADARRLMSREEIVSTLIGNLKEIIRKSRIGRLKKVLSSLFEEEDFECWFREEEDSLNTDRDKVVVDEEMVREYFARMSSGESALTYIFSNILAQIRYDSILLFDEPETHLHPNIISRLISTLYGLLEKFESFAIVATHSPIIVNEIHSASVLVIEKDHADCIVRPIGVETLGGNLGMIANEVFGNSVLPKHYRKMLSELKDYGYDYEEIVGILSNGDLPITMPVDLYLSRLFDEED